uniref:NAD(P)-binding domain-containing protein n=1 Tax=Phaeomonas parva TaxID=124430 RepID=A0A7S1TY36_9STRA|mmetsp:Transcript_20722/g.63040  ORF Transcript_20722/g.63040 Transcript_20722/m.63040 type:complete len:130 (+) Transcript_20722:709-1098(+)
MKPAYKFTNLFGKIMDYKIKGEDELRGLYAAKGDPKLTYTIVRPGGLTEEPLKGVKGIALNQGDEFIGRIGREDVAAVCVEAISQKSAANAIIEAYDRDTAQPLVKGAAPTRQRLGDTWDEMFAGVSAN